MYNFMRRPQLIFKGKLNQGFKLVEWADQMGGGIAEATIKTGSIVEIYGYPEGTVTKLMISGKRYGEHNLVSPTLQEIMQTCAAVPL